MTGDYIATKRLDGVEVQENGIIRNSEGYLIGRLSDEIDFDSEHLNVTSKEDVGCINVLKEANKAMEGVLETIGQRLGIVSGDAAGLINTVVDISEGMKWMEERKESLLKDVQSYSDDDPQRTVVEAQIVEVMLCLKALRTPEYCRDKAKGGEG